MEHPTTVATEVNPTADDLRRAYEDVRRQTRGKHGAELKRLVRKANDIQSQRQEVVFQKWAAQLPPAPIRPVPVAPKKGMTLAERLEIRIIKTETGHWLLSGSPQIRVEGRLERVNRVLWEEHKGPISKGEEVSPTCGLPKCVHPDHHRLVPEGRLTPREIAEVWYKAVNGVTVSDLATRYKISPQRVSQIKQGRRPAEIVVVNGRATLPPAEVEKGAKR